MTTREVLIEAAQAVRYILDTDTPDHDNRKLEVRIAQAVIDCVKQEALVAEKDAELERLRAEIAKLTKCIERMRVAGGSQEFHAAFELAKDAIAPNSDHHGEDWTQRDSEYL